MLLIGVSSDVIKILRKVRKQKLILLKILQRAYIKMYRRLNKETNLWKTKDKFITTKDIRIANLNQTLLIIYINPREFYGLKCAIKERMSIDK